MAKTINTNKYPATFEILCHPS